MNILLKILFYITTVPHMAWFVDITLKSVLILALAGVASLALHRASAAVRHLVWCLGMVSVLLLPLLTMALPQWRVSILPTWTTLAAAENENGFSNESAGAIRRAPTPAREDSESRTVFAPVAKAMPDTKTSPSRGSRLAASMADNGRKPELPARFWLVLFWGFGALVVLAPLLVGVRALARIARQARQIKNSAWVDLLGRLKETLRLERPVRLLESNTANIPMTWGHWRPAVLLPAGADAWTEERRRLVLLHELAHVKRWDCLTQMLARLTCALFWFNPIVWIAAWRMRVERERACDDLVLVAGSKPSDYADQLLDIATSFRGRSLVSALAIAMARPSTLEGRLLAILDKARNRRAVTRWTVLVGLMALGCFVVPVAMLRAGAGDGPVERKLEEPAKVRSEFKAAVPGRDGGWIELCAVALHSKTNQSWWRPDGTPCAPEPFTSGGHSTPDGDRQPREFLFRLGGLEEDSSPTWRSEPDGSGVGAYGPAMDRNRQSVHNTLMICARFPQDLSTAAMKIGVDFGPWTTMARSGPKDSSVMGGADSVLFAAGYQEDGMAHKTVSYKVEGKNTRLVAYDTDGREFTGQVKSGLGTGGFCQVTVQFPGLPLNRVKDFQFQTRPYHWVEFRNVSLVAGRKTNVEALPKMP